MYQTQMLKLLQDMGGRARYKQIFEKALEIDPAIYYSDIQKTLVRMKKWREVFYDNKTREYYLCSQIQDQDN